MTGLAGIFDPARGARPLAFASDHETCAVAGYLSNAHELVAGAGLGAGASVAQAVEALVRRDGSDAIGRLRGAFVVAVWDEASGRGVLATDQLGAGGLFYSVQGRRLTFGSEIRTVLEPWS